MEAWHKPRLLAEEFAILLRVRRQVRECLERFVHHLRTRCRRRVSTPTADRNPAATFPCPLQAKKMHTGQRARSHERGLGTHIVSWKVKRADDVSQAAGIPCDEGPIPRVSSQRVQLCNDPAQMRTCMRRQRERSCRQAPTVYVRIHGLRKEPAPRTTRLTRQLPKSSFKTSGRRWRHQTPWYKGRTRTSSRQPLRHKCSRAARARGCRARRRRSWRTKGQVSAPFAFWALP